MNADYPSLRATLKSCGPTRFTVTDSLTHRALGFVWWSAKGTSKGQSIVWHWIVEGPNGGAGKTNTQRNAVQALRDLANGQRPLDLCDRDDLDARIDDDDLPPIIVRPIVVPVVVVPVVVVQPAPSSHIQWGDQTNAVRDLTAAIAAALARHAGSK